MSMPTVSSVGITDMWAATKPTKASDAAQQFESLLIAQMLRSAWDSGLSGPGEDEEDSEMSVMRDLAGQQFAQGMAKQGGFGLSGLIVKGLPGE